MNVDLAVKIITLVTQVVSSPAFGEIIKNLEQIFSTLTAEEKVMVHSILDKVTK